MASIRNKFILGLVLLLLVLAGLKKFVFDEVQFLIGENTYLRSSLDSQQKYTTGLSEELWRLKSKLFEISKKVANLETIEKKRQKELLTPLVDVKVYNSTGKGASVTLLVDNIEVASELGLNSGFWKSLGSFKGKEGSNIKLVARLSSSPEFAELFASHVITGTETTLRFIITCEGIIEAL